jgi:SPP1 family predicted phage head-tail adaptor
MASTPKNPLLIPAGDLRHVVNILEPTLSTDASGAVQTWTTFLADVRAAIDPIRGTELIRSGQDVTQTFITVTIRYVPGVTAAMRVEAHHGTYVIQSIENISERNRVLKLLCMAVAPNA